MQLILLFHLVVARDAEKEVFILALFESLTFSFLSYGRMIEKFARECQARFAAATMNRAAWSCVAVRARRPPARVHWTTARAPIDRLGDRTAGKGSTQLCWSFWD